MNIKVVADSCCDLNEELKGKLNISQVPLTIYLDDEEYKDDESFDQEEFIPLMKASEQGPKTACPSPNDYLNAYGEDEKQGVFVVTLSSQLSSSYNSAILAKDMLKEELNKKFVHVFDSKSASVGETLISLKIIELAKENYSNLEIVEKANEYIEEMKTFFLSESLDNLIKAGRINKLVGKVATAFSIKPIMGATDKGTIKLVEKVRGSKKAFRRLVDVIGEQGEKLDEKILGIAHCNCKEKAEEFKKEVIKKYNFKDVIIVETAGISTVYVNDGGIIIAF